MAGFEPAASCSQSRRANQAAPHPVAPESLYRQPSWPRTSRRPRSQPACSQSASCPLSRTGTLRHSAQARGRSSMAEPQPSKLVMRVRFPSPALIYAGQSRCTYRLAYIGCRSCHIRATREHRFALCRARPAVPRATRLLAESHFVNDHVSAGIWSAARRSPGPSAGAQHSTRVE
jgi:hypothetical protein